MIIYDFDQCPVSDRNGVYGGRAGSKEGILIDGEYWLVKYPQKTASMKNVTISYTTSFLLEPKYSELNSSHSLKKEYNAF